MQGKEPALRSQWFLETAGAFKGPFSTDDIVKLIITGRLKLESPVYNAEDHSCVKAADLIPLLHLEPISALNPLPQTEAAKDWHPPPRPPEHAISNQITGATEAQTSQIEYLVLFNEAQVAKKGPPSFKPFPPGKSALEKIFKSDRKERGLHDGPHGFLVRTLTALTSVLKSASTYVKEIGTGIVKLKQEYDTQKVQSELEAQKKPKQIFFQIYSKGLAAAAAIALVFLGTYGVIRTLASKAKREIAGQNDPAAQKVDRMRPNRISMPPATLSGSTELGSGGNQIVQSRGGVSESRMAKPSDPSTTSNSMPTMSSAPTSNSPTLNSGESNGQDLQNNQPQDSSYSANDGGSNDAHERMMQEQQQMLLQQQMQTAGETPRYYDDPPRDPAGEANTQDINQTLPAENTPIDAPAPLGTNGAEVDPNAGATPGSLPEGMSETVDPGQAADPNSLNSPTPANDPNPVQ